MDTLLKEELEIGDKYIIFASTDKNKKVLKKYTKIWNETENQYSKQ